MTLPACRNVSGLREGNPVDGHEDEDRYRAARQVEVTRQLESLGVLAAGLAHEYNNLLMGILGNVDLALDEVSRGSTVTGYLRNIESSAKRAADLTAQLLAYSGQGRMVSQRLDLSTVAGEVARLLGVSIPKEVRLTCRRVEDLPAVEGDPVQIRQMVMNLIQNAVEALGDEGGEVTVTTGSGNPTRKELDATLLGAELPAGPYLCLEVRDTGSGIEEAILDRIFEPFFTTRFPGRGLGLSAVLGIVRSHGGTLSVDSIGGRGTTFRVLLPAAPPDQLAEVTVTTWTGEGTVLLIDDDETIRLIGGKILERAGFRVLTAEDGLRGLEVFRRHAAEVACVVLDVTMPRLDGIKAFDELRLLSTEVPVLLCSGYTEEELRQRRAGRDFAGFLQKPYRAPQLLAALRECLTS